MFFISIYCLHQFCYCYLMWFHQFCLSINRILSRWVAKFVPGYSKTTSHRAPKRKCETDTNQGNFCAIATILSLLFFNPEFLLILSFVYFPLTHVSSHLCFLVKIVSSCIAERSSGTPVFYFVLFLRKIVFSSFILFFNLCILFYFAPSIVTLVSTSIICNPFSILLYFSITLVSHVPFNKSL